LTPSVVARLGYAWATAVGASWGFIWSTGRIERRNGLLVFTGMPRWSFRRGGVCVGGCYLTDSHISDSVLEHEAVHREQWRRYGMLLPVLYALAGRAPLTNRFEIEAGLEAGGYLSPETSGAVSGASGAVSGASGAVSGASGAVSGVSGAVSGASDTTLTA